MNLTEFCHSDLAIKEKINNEPSKNVSDKCLLFLSLCVKPLEDLLGTGIIHHSGYRSPLLNKAVKGKPFSQHISGEALDFHHSEINIVTCYKKIISSDLAYCQCILEGRPGHQWIHISYNTLLTPDKQKQQHLEILDA